MFCREGLQCPLGLSKGRSSAPLPMQRARACVAGSRAGWPLEVRSSLSRTSSGRVLVVSHRTSTGPHSYRDLGGRRGGAYRRNNQRRLWVVSCRGRLKKALPKGNELAGAGCDKAQTRARGSHLKRNTRDKKSGSGRGTNDPSIHGRAAKKGKKEQALWAGSARNYSSLEPFLIKPSALIHKATACL